MFKFKLYYFSAKKTQFSSIYL